MGEDEIEALVPKARRKSSLFDALHGDTDWQVAGDDPRWIAHIETACRTGIEHEAAAMALVSFDTISVSGAVALPEHVASIEAKDCGAWPDLVDQEDGKSHSWHYFLIINLAAALTPEAAA
jgi:hypothetical protein